MDIEEYQSKDIAGKILYLASLFKGIKDHLDVLNEREEFNQVESQIFTILNDLELGIHELDIRKGIDKKERKREYENLEISSRYFINYFKCICFFSICISRDC